MSYNDADRMKMTQKEDKNRNNTIHDGSSVADAKGKTRQKNITILHEFHVLLQSRKCSCHQFFQ